MKRCPLLVLLAVASTVPAHAAQPWPSFRGSRASGVAEGPAAQKWNGETGEGVLWKASIPGLSLSSPIVWGDLVFVATAISSDPNATFRHGLYGDVEPSKDVSKHSWRVLALHRKTGKIAWERTAHEGIPKTKRHPKSSQATPTPATDGKTLVVSFGSEGLYAYDLAGKPLGKKDLGILNAGWFYDPDYEWGYSSSPVVYKDPMGEVLMATPAISDGVIYVRGLKHLFAIGAR